MPEVVHPSHGTHEALVIVTFRPLIQSKELLGSLSRVFVVAKVCGMHKQLCLSPRSNRLSLCPHPSILHGLNAPMSTGNVPFSRVRCGSSKKCPGAERVHRSSEAK